MLAIAVAVVLTVGVGMAGAYTRGSHGLDCTDYAELPACQDAFAQSSAPAHAVIETRLALVDQPTTFTADLALGPGDDEAITGYAWDFGQGDTASVAHPVRTFTTDGKHEVTVALTLADGSTVRSGEELEVTDPQPLGMFLDAAGEGVAGQSVELVAGAYDPDSPDSGAATFDWDFGDGSPTAHGGDVTHVFANPGSYEVTATARLDGKTATRSAWILMGQTSPTDGCNGPQGFDVEVGDSVDIECASSAQIDFGDHSPPVSGTSASHTYTAAGDYDASATLDGGATVRKFWVHVTPVPPRDVFVAYEGMPHAGAPVSLFPFAVGFDDTIAAFTWSFADGTPDQLADPNAYGTTTHTYANPGVYKTTVTVHQPGGPDATDSAWVPVDPANLARTVGIGLPDEVEAGQEAFFMAGVFDESGLGSQAGYAWSFDGVPDTADTDAYATHTFAAGGTHTVKVVVSEPGKATVQRARTFSVTGPAPAPQPTSTPPPHVSATPTPLPFQAPPRLSVSGKLPKRGSLAKGIRFGVTCSMACTLKATLTLPRPLARRYKLKGALATGTLHLTRAGSGTLKLRASKAARKLARKLKGKTVTLTVTGAPNALRRSLKLTG